MKTIFKVLGIASLFIGCILKGCLSVSAASPVLISEENFSDLVFQRYVREKIDTNGNGILEESEQKGVTSILIDWNDYNITDFKGIEIFSNLEELSITAAYYPDDEETNSFYSGSIIIVDISHNTKLKSLVCSAEEIKGVDLTDLTELEEVRISAKHQQLDLSTNRKLREVVMSNVRLAGEFPNLEELNVKKCRYG